MDNERGETDEWDRPVLWHTLIGSGADDAAADEDDDAEEEEREADEEEEEEEEEAETGGVFGRCVWF